MKKKLLTLLLVVMTAGPAAVFGANSGLTFSVLTKERALHEPSVEELGRLLDKKLAIRSELVSKSKIDDIADEFGRGSTDVFIGSVEDALQLCTLTKSGIVLAQLRGKSVPQGMVLLVSQKTLMPFEKQQQLTAATPRESAAQSLLHLNLFFHSKGFTLVEKGGSSGKDKRVSYSLVASEAEVMSDVARGKVDFGIVSASALAAESKARVVTTFVPLPSTVVVFSSKVESLLAGKLVTALASYKGEFRAGGPKEKPSDVVRYYPVDRQAARVFRKIIEMRSQN
jgi:hypothetical protein